MNLEEAFFSSQPYFPPKRKIDLLVIDFDGTCTTKDTSSLIAQTAINAVVSQVNSAEGEATSLSVKSELEAKLDALIKNYAQKRDHLLQETLPSLDQLTPEEEEQLEDEFDMVWLGEFMDRLSDFDREMNKVVVESSILAGIKRGMLAKAGASTIELRPGCLEFIEKAVGAGIPVCIVSVNWSAEMVAAALAQQGGADCISDGTINITNRSNGTGAALPVIIADALGGAALGGGAELSPPPHGTVMVYCNELEYFGDCSTGNLRRRCECGGDKARLFDDLLLTLAAADFGQHQHQQSSSLFNDVVGEEVEEKWLVDGEGAGRTDTIIQKQQEEEEGEEEENVRGMNIYIGDSMTDVPPLISADLGIVIGKDPLIRRVMDVAGIRLQPLTAVPLSLGNDMGYDASEKPTLYEAPCWAEIDAFLFNQQFVAPSSSLSSAEQQERVVVLQEELGNRQLQQAGTGGVGGVEALPPFSSTPAATLVETSSQQRLTTQQGLVGGEHNASTVSLATTSSSSPALQFRLSTDDNGPQYILPTPPAAFSQVQQQSQPQHPHVLTAAASLASSSFTLHSASLPRKISSFREGNIPQVLSIAGSDSGGGAGIQADLKTCVALGVFGSCAVTALTAQNSYGVEAIHLPPPEFVRRQIAAVMKDVSTQYSSNNTGSSGGGSNSVAAAAAAALAAVNCTTTPPLTTSSSSGGGRIVVKIGMLGCSSTVEAVAEELSIWGPPPIVLDPVLIATSGDSLASGGVAQAIVQHLFPLATIVTPNIPEACRLLDDEGRVIIDVDGMKAAAEELMRLGKPKYVLIKGGHLNHTGSGDGSGTIGGGGTPPPPPSLLSSSISRKEVVDILYDGRIMLELRSPWVPTNNTHGTGCTLSSAIAAELAKGADVAEAVRRGRQYLWRTLERSAGLPLGSGGGGGRQRAMNHGWKIADWKTDLLLLSGSGGENSISGGGGSLTAATVRVPTTTINRIPNPIDLSLYAVTDEKCNAKWGRNITEAVAAVLEGGATVVQLREKDMIDKNNSTGQLVELGCQLLQMCRNKGVPLIINDRLDVCLAVGADGLHVGQGDLNAATARKLLGPDKILGVSVKTVEEAIIAEKSGADYLGAGAVYATGTKEDSSVVGVGRVVEIRGKVGIPVVAIGGIGGGNVEEVMRERKVDGVAVVSALFDSEDVVEATRVLKRKVVGLMREGGGS
jgi:hydroxymethylpyrimidine kinase/phosphomethylpyrimidine kinase/thiamine-phosphate diphosphorylase